MISLILSEGEREKFLNHKQETDKYSQTMINWNLIFLLDFLYFPLQP